MGDRKTVEGKSSGYPDVFRHCQQKTWKIRQSGRLLVLCGRLWKNGTVYNGKHIETGRGGRVKPILLSSGDIFFFGGGREAIFSPQTIWARFSTDSYSDTIQVEDTMDEDLLVFMDGEKQIRLERPEKGTVVEGESGMGIYMGDMTYLIGDMRLQRK
jgi:hypothetical protein